MNKLSGLMLAEGAGGDLLEAGPATLGSGASLRIEFARLGGGIAGTDGVVASAEGAPSSLADLEIDLTDGSWAGVLAFDPCGTLPECPRVIIVYSASTPPLS